MLLAVLQQSFIKFKFNFLRMHLPKITQCTCLHSPYYLKPLHKFLGTHLEQYKDSTRFPASDSYWNFHWLNTNRPPAFLVAYKALSPVIPIENGNQLQKKYYLELKSHFYNTEFHYSRSDEIWLHLWKLSLPPKVLLIPVIYLKGSYY